MVLVKEGVKKHKPSRTYYSWQAMKRRCSPRTVQGKQLKRYVLLGYCERWELFKNFLEDMGIRPLGKTLDRINNDLGYFPGNCRWASPRMQGRNTRVNIIIEIAGESRVYVEWVEILNLKKSAVNSRITKGATHKEAIIGLFNKKHGLKEADIPDFIKTFSIPWEHEV